MSMESILATPQVDFKKKSESDSVADVRLIT
jgi:hypothetical protein